MHKKPKCDDCGGEVTLGYTLCKSCSRKGDRNPMWTGGKTTNGKGYIRLHSPDHPNSDTKGYVYEHRLVMERTLGRYLEPHENVHHKNGVKEDNRPKNLELWAVSQPTGQRVSDMVEWAKEILKTYGNIFTGN